MIKERINGWRWFEVLPKAICELNVEGYQVYQKGLNVRASNGGNNPHSHLLHDVVIAFTVAHRLMAGIDKVVQYHDSWPCSFKTDLRSKA